MLSQAPGGGDGSPNIEFILARFLSTIFYQTIQSCSTSSDNRILLESNNCPEIVKDSEKLNDNLQNYHVIIVIIYYINLNYYVKHLGFGENY